MDNLMTELPSLFSATVKEPYEYFQALKEGFERLNIRDMLENYSKIIIKPNVVNGSPPPVTTDVTCVKAIAELLSEFVDCSVYVAEGSGEGDTLENFQKNGYGTLGVPLIDLDSLPSKSYRDDRATLLKEIYLPDFLLDAAVISVPPAKDHTMTGVTLGLKNMVGCLPARKYGGFWSFKKSRLHQVDIDAAVADLILYIEPVLTVIDARLGLKGGHLWGSVPEPSLNRLIMGRDVLETDREGAVLLGHDPDSIRHLALADNFRR